MATKFDPKEYAKKRLIGTVAKYFPMEYIKVKAGRTGYRLGESTITIIERSKNIIDAASESDIEVPYSTVNIFKIGSTLQHIFQNLSDYQVVSQVKARSRRGYRKEIDLIDFDLKKIELAFKKSPNPSVRHQKDVKIIKTAQKFYIKLLDEKKYQNLLEDVIKQQELFIVDSSDGKAFFDSLYRLLNTFIEKIDEKARYETQLVQTKNEVKAIKKKLNESENQLPQIKNRITVLRKESGIHNLVREKEQVYSDPDFSLFLKILTTCLDRYIRMIERRENIILEQREDFLNLILEPSKYQGLNEELWKQIVFIIEAHGIELLGSKGWFKFEDSLELRQFFVRKDILEKYARVRKIEEKYNEIEVKLLENPEYSEAQQLLQEFDRQETLLNKLEKEIPKIDRKIISLSSELESEEETIRTLLS